MQFSSLDQAAVNLFALLNGDEIADTFNDVYACQVCALLFIIFVAHGVCLSVCPQPFLSRIYLYSFVVLFIYAVLNIFIAIIEDSFITSTLSVAQKKRVLRDPHSTTEQRQQAEESPSTGHALAQAHMHTYGTASSATAGCASPPTATQQPAAPAQPQTPQTPQQPQQPQQRTRRPVTRAHPVRCPLRRRRRRGRRSRSHAAGGRGSLLCLSALCVARRGALAERRCGAQWQCVCRQRARRGQRWVRRDD